MMEQAIQLLDLYRPSFVKSEAVSLLRAVANRDDPERPLKFQVYDIVYAFQRLEAHRLGIRADKRSVAYNEFRQGYLTSLAMWVPGQNPLADQVKALIDHQAAGRDEEVASGLKKLFKDFENHHSQQQKGVAETPRDPKPIDQYILDLLAVNPTLSEKALWRQIEIDSEGLHNPIIGEIAHDSVWIIDPTPEHINRSKKYSRSSFRSRLSRLKKNKSH